MRTKYGNGIRWVYKDLPLSFHPNALPAALGAECAREHGKFWEFHDKLFETQSEWSSDSNATQKFKQYAKDLGLNSITFNACVDSQKYNSEIQKDSAQAAAFGVSGTPNFFVNGINIPGAFPLATFESIIDEELAR
ncbi:MAG: DsbA family protein [Candidatus Diapherotrites archaeon]